VFLNRSGAEEEFPIESSRFQNKFLILELKGISSIDEASELVGTEVLIPEDRLKPLEKDNYYNFQIIGCTAYQKDGRVAGIVKDILSIRDNNLLVIEKDQKEILIPFSRSICLEIDLETVFRMD